MPLLTAKDSEALAHPAEARRGQAPLRLFMALVLAIGFRVQLDDPLLWGWLSAYLAAEVFELWALWPFRLDKPAPPTWRAGVGVFSMFTMAAAFGAIALPLWLAPGSLGPAGITVNADGVTIRGITVSEFYNGLKLLTNDGLTLDDVNFKENVNGVHKEGSADGVTDVAASLIASAVVTKVGFGLDGDRTQIRGKLGIEPVAVLDLDTVFRALGYRRSIGVKAAIAVLFNRRLVKSKRIGTSNWSNRRLDERQLQYAANDAWAAIQVHAALLRAGQLEAAS